MAENMTTEEKVEQFIDMTFNVIEPDALARFLELGTDEHVLYQVAAALADKTGGIEHSHHFIARVMTLLNEKYGQMIAADDDSWRAGFLTGIQFGIGLLATLRMRSEFEGMDTPGVAAVTTSVANLAAAALMRQSASAEWPEVIDGFNN